MPTTESRSRRAAPFLARELRLAGAVTLAILSLGGCATREHLTYPGLQAIRTRDPELARLRVYPSLPFVLYYKRSLGHDLEVGARPGEVFTGVRGQEVELTFRRKISGAILESEMVGEQMMLWVTFDARCKVRSCALGFALSQDQLFRLVRVPTIPQFSEPEVHRRRVAPRNLMRKSRIYARSKGEATYLTTRGIVSSIALDIKKRRAVDVETVVVPAKGVD